MEKLDYNKAFNADCHIQNEEAFINERTIEIDVVYPVIHIEYFIRDKKNFAVMLTQHSGRVVYDIKELKKGIYGPEAGHIMDQMQNNIKTKIKSFMNTHQLKCDPQYFRALYDGSKRFEVRKNDRDFNIGDRLEIFEWSKDEGHTGRWINFEITYILKKKEFIQDGYVVLSLKKV